MTADESRKRRTTRNCRFAPALLSGVPFSVHHDHRHTAVSLAVMWLVAFDHCGMRRLVEPHVAPSRKPDHRYRPPARVLDGRALNTDLRESANLDLEVIAHEVQLRASDI
jgi:hypothetical protein